MKTISGDVKSMVTGQIEPVEAVVCDCDPEFPGVFLVYTVHDSWHFQCFLCSTPYCMNGKCGKEI